MRALGAKIQKFCVLRAEFFAKNKAENAFFPKIANGGGGAHERCIDWLGNADWPEKKGMMTTAHPHTPFLGQYPPDNTLSLTHTPGPIRQKFGLSWGARHVMTQLID